MPATILRLSTLVVAFCCLWVNQTYAVQIPTLQEQRADYLRAKKMLRAGQQSQFTRLKKQLRSYVLYPYLEYDELSLNLRNADKRAVNGFLQRYEHLAVANRLRARWLKNLGRQKNWLDFLDAYDDTLADTELRCYYLRAKIQTGSAGDVWPLVPNLWVVGQSQPKQCDPLFEQWVDGGYLTAAHKWERFRLAMDKRNISLAKYLAGLMQAKDKAAADKFLRFHRSPELIKKRGQLSRYSSHDADIAIHAIRRLARKDTRAATKRLDDLSAQFEFSVEGLAAAQKTIAYRILNKPQRYGLDWVSRQLQDGIDPDVAVYAARIALLFEDWQTVLKAIDVMPESLRKTSRWQYWHAKASMQENPKLDEVWQHNAFAELAGKRDYYGFLAAQLLERSFDFNDHAVSFSPDFQRQIRQLPGLQTALELFAAGELTAARREWRHALLELPDTHKIAAAHVAKEWGWASQAVMTTIMANAWDELSLRFPLTYREYMNSGARAAGIDLAWVYAIARQESAMNPTAISHAGARGLMQLMPATAKATVKRNALPVDATDLLNEKTNSVIGSAHLGELFRSYSGNRILASAAYNAGKARSDAWLKRSSRQQSFDVWVETIPFKETRNYVQNVLMFAAIYDYRLENDVAFVQPEEWIIKP